MIRHDKCAPFEAEIERLKRENDKLKRAIMNLRFIIRDGQRVLQYGVAQHRYEWKKIADDFEAQIPSGLETVWYDVPLCDEHTGEEIVQAERITPFWEWEAKL